MKSRVNREVHARFCEGLGVKFPGATRPGMIQFLIGSALFIRSNPAFLGDKLGQDVVAISVMKGGKR